MEIFLIRSYKYSKVPRLKQVSVKKLNLELNPFLQDLSGNIGFEITDVIEDSLFGIETTKCAIDLETMQTTIRGWRSPEGKFCHEVTVDRLGKVFFHALHESAQPHYYLDEMGPPLAGILSSAQIQRMKGAYDAPFCIRSSPTVVRYSDADGDGVFCGLTDSKIRFKKIIDFWDFMIASKFYNYSKFEDFDRVSCMKGLSTELSSLIKKFSTNIRNYFDVKPSPESTAIKTVLRECIHIDFIRVRHFFRTVMLKPLANVMKGYQVIEGEFDEGEKAVLRVTVQFLEGIAKVECLSHRDIVEWFQDLDKISPKIYGTIVYKTLKANNNYQRCLASNSPKIQKLKDQKSPLSAQAEKERTFYPWIDDVREMWRLSTFIKSLVSKITNFDAMTYRLQPQESNTVAYIDSKMLWLASDAVTGTTLAVNLSAKSVILFENSHTDDGSKPKIQIVDSVSYHHCQESFMANAGYFLIVRPKHANLEDIQTEWLENVDVKESLINRTITTKSHHLAESVEKIAVSRRFTTILSLVKEEGSQGRRLDIYEYDRDKALQMLGSHLDLEESFEQWIATQPNSLDADEQDSVFGAHFENQKVASRRMFDVKPLNSMIVVIRHRNDLDESNHQQSVTSDFLFLRLKRGNTMDLVASKSLITKLSSAVVTGIGAHTTAQKNYVIFESRGYGYLLKLSTSDLSEQELYLIFREQVVCLSNLRSMKPLRKIMTKYPQGKASFHYSQNQLGFYVVDSGRKRTCECFKFKMIY